MEPAPLKQIIDLTGKVAIVTGGAMGIGFGIAYRLAEAGAMVIIADMNKAAAEESAATLAAKGWRATAVAADVSDAAQVQAMTDAAVKAYGAVDILVNNAGVYPSVPVMQMQEKEFDKIISINLKGVFLATKAAAAQMIAQGKGGKIITITSVDALHPSMVGLAAYDASKHGVWGFTKNVALELAPHHIWVNAIAPGPVRTPGTGANNMTPEEMAKNMKPLLDKGFVPSHRHELYMIPTALIARSSNSASGMVEKLKFRLSMKRGRQ